MYNAGFYNTGKVMYFHLLQYYLHKNDFSSGVGMRGMEGYVSLVVVHLDTIISSYSKVMQDKFCYDFTPCIERTKWKLAKHHDTVLFVSRPCAS